MQSRKTSCDRSWNSNYSYTLTILKQAFIDYKDFASIFVDKNAYYQENYKVLYL